MLGRQWRIERLLVRAVRLDNRRFPPAAEEFVDGACEFVDNAWGQERRETACEADEKILVGQVSPPSTRAISEIEQRATFRGMGPNTPSAERMATPPSFRRSLHRP